MTQTFTKTGFGGEQLEGTPFARLIAEGGQPYGAPVSLTTGLADPNALKVTAAPGTLKVAVSPGAVTGWGHRYTSDDVVTLTLPAIASGTRWDLVAVRRSWVATSDAVATMAERTAQLVVVPGTSTRGFPAARKTTPGTVDDQPLALVQVTAGNATPTQIVPLTVFPSKVHAASDLMAVPQGVGTLARVAGVLWRRELVGASPTWVRDGGPFAMAAFTGVVGVATPPNSIIGPLSYTFPAGRFTVAPVITFGYSDTRCTVSATALTAAGFNVYIRNVTGQNSPAGGVLHWVATQISPTSATG